MRTLQSFTLAFLFLASAVPSNAQEGVAEARVVVREGAPLTVECGLRVEQRAEWRRDGGPVPDDLRAGETAAGGRVTARLHAASARPHHAGLYSCGREPAQRVRVVVQPAPALAASGAAPATTAATPAADSVPVVTQVPVLLKFDLYQKFSLNCTQLESTDAEDIYWKKNGTEVSQLWDLAGRYELKEDKFHMTSRANEDDFGNYTCHKRGVEGVAGAWEVHIKSHAKLPVNTNVVEGQKLKLQCKLIGKPYPPVTWLYNNTDVEGGNVTDVTVALGGRVKLQTSEQGVEGGELVVDSAERSDAAMYVCMPKDGVPASTTLRVKDMYAALWPFLGICIEVFILCAIILVYEKRRTKPELDDSDTDNHDQKKS